MAWVAGGEVGSTLALGAATAVGEQQTTPQGWQLTASSTTGWAPVRSCRSPNFTPNKYQPLTINKTLVVHRKGGGSPGPKGGQLGPPLCQG